MANLEKVFEDIIQNSEKWLQSKKGSDFEDRFESSCKKMGFTREISDDYKNELKEIKKVVLNDLLDEPIKNIFNGRNEMVDMFITQPFGSQSYPDFLIFTQNYIIPIEIKYSSETATHPMWNGNLPKSNGIYIFGSYKRKAVTFFRGIDVLNNEDRKKLIDFWRKERENYQKFKQKLKEDTLFENRYGFDVYIRETYTQNKQINKNAITDFFTNLERKQLEQNVIDYIKRIKNDRN